MTIFVPSDQARDFDPELLDTALLIVAGGGNNDNDYDGTSDDATLSQYLARQIGAVKSKTTFATDQLRTNHQR